MWLALVACGSGPVPLVEPPPRLPHRTWTGSAALDRAGEALSLSAGELPILVSAPTLDHDQPSEAIYPGGAYRLAVDTPEGPLDAVAPVHYRMVSLGGHTPQFVGDLDGQGGTDVALDFADSSAAPRKSIRLFSSEETGTVDLPRAWGTVLVVAEERGGPSALCGAGDLDGDGSADLAMGIAAGLETAQSRVAIVQGPHPHGDYPFVDFVRMVAPLDEQAGRTLGCGRDLDGDGVNDLLVGAHEALEGDGKVYLVSLPAETIHELAIYPTWTGEPGGGNAGQALAMGGDLDGDGLDDAVVGAPLLHAAQGRAYVLTDKDGGDLAESWLVVDGVGDRNWTGRDSAIGDVDGDDTQDLLVGVPRIYSAGADRPGRVAVFLGPLAPGHLTTDDDADMTLVGSDQPDAFGVALEVADIDGDAIDDVVVGAPLDPRRGHQAGAVHLFIGGVDLP